MATIKQKARKSTGGKAPINSIHYGIDKDNIMIDMFRNHAGPFALSKHIEKKQEVDINIYKRHNPLW